MSKSKLMSPEYKCRRCGKIYQNENIKEYSDNISYIITRFEMAIRDHKPFKIDIWDSKPEISLIGAHECEDGGLGVSDLIGVGYVSS